MLINGTRTCDVFTWKGVTQKVNDTVLIGCVKMSVTEGRVPNIFADVTRTCPPNVKTTGPWPPAVRVCKDKMQFLGKIPIATCYGAIL